MIYGAFILLVNDTISYICVMQVWAIIFSIRMYLKELSLRKKAGWEEYSQRSWLLVPKFNGRLVDSVIFYGSLGAFCYWVYTNGGMMKTCQIIQGQIETI